ncbi:hypothetical protein [Agromyces aerolatus]|uniref:hypothetical protein n=1 Tax=Agromyces sp. LY-1074 TaxID=3074080 RepID=UPI00285E8AA2|nr:MULTISPECIES: hypothetical protein [unclassified Agromyces]MDR5699658.1 hypothetical protein [Agromyces sp. LY-1074]MDR5705954.1 hypothetical protein [Agromyces sp. LY-1358]
MNTLWRRLFLWLLAALGVFVGGWALFAPHAFYESFPFPPIFGSWVSGDGPFNEHLVRDVGSLYLALAAASVVAALMRRADASIAVGVAWLVFSVPHLVYHLGHLDHLAPIDAIGQPISLAVSLVLAIPLCIPTRREAANPVTVQREEPAR